MAGPDRQFDPVANAALGAIRASDRGLRQLQNSTPVPELPSQSQTTRTIRDGIKSASSLSPPNVLAGQGSFSLPFMDSGAGSPNASALPGGQTSLPDPAGVFGGSVTLSDLSPQNILSTLTDGSTPTPPMPGNGGNGGNGGSRGGGQSGGSGSGTGDANAPKPSRGAGQSSR